MDIRNAQRKLGLTPDGDLGPKTWAALFQSCGAKPAHATVFGQAMATYGRDIDTPLEACHFLAQGGHETQGFGQLVEMGSGDKNHDGLDDYLVYLDRRTDLGNTPALDGDGEKYRGRGIFQITGTSNYRAYGAKIGVDLLTRPERAAEPEIAARTALEFWRTKGLGVYAAADNVLAITKRINGGTNGLSDRQARLAKLKALFA